ncbi:TadE/TadG family type IV pilus assembly protein [Brevibacillus sp. BC25]|uniref:TadE/TadG family type IV pilus assembly protein n=1 Tax=Brevibacillus sp. BC25 TaxID=1144308 RepID=UPI000270FBBF|nr:TadE family protein [Brevibacillus sp. BC25]EJL31352.1 TadE-like protein [Brevibacillus sp. BC25]
MRLKKIVSNEKGSVTVEFIAILPFVFLIMLICWQFLVGVYGVIISQSAANEAAKVYAITGNSGEAIQAAKSVVNAAGGYISFNEGDITWDGNGYFTAKVGVQMELGFLPDWLYIKEEDRYISFDREMKSRVMN